MDILLVIIYKPTGLNMNLVRKLFKLSSKALEEALGLNVAKNLKYMPEDIVRSLIYISLKNASAESGSKDLARDMDAPFPDVILRRLESIDLS